MKKCISGRLIQVMGAGNAMQLSNCAFIEWHTFVRLKRLDRMGQMMATWKIRNRFTLLQTCFWAHLA